MSRKKEPVCNRDCLNCIHDDCICDDMTAADYAELRELDEYAMPKTRKQRAIAAYQKAYYEENRESIAAKKKAYALKMCRKSYGYTQRDLAARMNVSHQLISHLETARLNIELHLDALLYWMPDLRDYMAEVHL